MADRIYNFQGVKEPMAWFSNLVSTVSGALWNIFLITILCRAGRSFWMWVSVILGMATIYAEATLAQRYKTIKDGELVGGPSQAYLSNTIVST